MDILIPLVALVVLIVVWAKLCPPYKEPYVPNPYVSLHSMGIAVDISIEPEIYKRISKKFEQLSGSFSMMTQATNDANHHMHHLHTHFKPLREK